MIVPTLPGFNWADAARAQASIASRARVRLISTEQLHIYPKRLTPLRRWLQLAALLFFLAHNAMPRPGNRIQAPLVDLIAALFAFAVAADGNVGQRALHHLQKLPVVIAARKQKLLLVGARGAVGNVLRRVRRLRGAPVFLAAGNAL